MQFPKHSLLAWSGIALLSLIAAFCLVLLVSSLTDDGIRKNRIRKEGNMILFTIFLDIKGISGKFEVSGGLIEIKKVARADYSLKDHVPDLHPEKLQHDIVQWSKAKDEIFSDKFHAAFITLDGRPAYVRNSVQFYRVYRKYNEKLEFDYGFHLRGKSHLELAHYIQEIDQSVVSAIINSKVVTQ